MTDPQGNVIAALAAVVADLPAIGKDGRGPRDQGGYAYRGIEQITREAAPLLAKHGVVFVPHVTAVEIRDLIVAGKPWTDTILTVRYRVYGPGGPKDYVEACVVGIGRDNSDKGANKAMTQAFKYALLQTLCISDAKDDTDGQTHEADPRDYADRATGEIRPLTDLDAMGPRELNDALRARDLPLGGTLDEMRARLKEIMGEPSPGAESVAGSTGDGVVVAEPRVAASPVLTGDGVLLGEVQSPSPLALDGADVGPGSSPSAPSGYDGWPNADLLAECAVHEIEMPKSATKERMVTALRVWDQTYREGYVEEDERPF